MEMRWGDGNCHQTVVVAQQIRFGNAEFKVENVEIFAFNATHVPLAENACAECPVDVF